MTSVLIAGIGNIFAGDDGFGVEVAQHLATRPPRNGVRVADFGIRGVHLAYELLDGCDGLILVDAVPMGADPPGTLAVIEPNAPDAPGDGSVDGPVIDPHRMSPDVVLATLARLGGRVDRVVVVGCQPAFIGPAMGLSPPVAAAVGPAADLCRQLADEMVQASQKETA